MNGLLQNATTQINVLNLNNVLNGAQVNVLSDILNNSKVLSDNTVVLQNVLNNNQILTDFLKNNNIAVDLDRVIAIDVLTAPVTLYVFERR
ncbi:MAG: hypothetical protein AVDCRST_MAG77-44 [uncultured Chloroflexi bacterium]|uniref:Uncharacterized protein n=1 Tax=uncultured Chloroflexota bacterium TaxID=166587 RepID=A0A6J4H4Y0_9CHLR|nr:MAG: hypothetical protein AVDCRST_MAG77-44 [uncultured Chloroflexota bacterium]